MNKIFFIILLIINLINTQNIFANENKILFKIDNQSYTLFDFENRKKYLDFIGDNSETDEKTILNDFISSLIFNKYYLDSNYKLNIEDKILEIYNNIKNQNLKNNKNLQFELDEKNIFYNLELDFIRKTILEEMLDKKKSDIFSSKNEIDLIYNFTIKYLIIEKDKLNYSNTFFKNLEDLEGFLINNNIDYFSKKSQINSIDDVSEEIKEKILSNNNFFKIEDSKYVSYVYILKSFETYEGLIANILSLESAVILEQDDLSCQKIIENNNNIFVTKEYEFNKLNNQIKKELININDYISFKNENKMTYVMLCGIKFDKKILDNLQISNNISSIVKELELNFVNKYSKKYQLENNYE